MWRIERIKAKNIVSFKELDYSVQHGVATLIFGENLDGINQRHNGSGKSALIEAISFALTGDYLRDIKTTEELINDFADSCTVEITLSNTYSNLTMVIKRSIFRKEAQRVDVHQYLDGEEVNAEKTVQPSVNDYNKLILNEIGLSKDDIYSNYILCRNRYTSFLSAKDKDKKDLINRFSNGVMVDESIEALMLDIHEAETVVNECHDELVRYQARIDTINEQIASAEEDNKVAIQNRADKIASLENGIAEKRAKIREYALVIEKANARLDHLDKMVGDELENLEKSDKSFSECFMLILELFRDNQLPTIDNVSEKSDSLRAELEGYKDELENTESRLTQAESAVSDAEKAYGDAKERHQVLVDKLSAKNDEHQLRIGELTRELDNGQKKIDEFRNVIRDYREKANNSSKLIESIRVKLHGTITCPKCGHQFVLDSDKSVDELRQTLKLEEESLKGFNDVVDKANNDVKEIVNREDSIRTESKELERKIRLNEQDIDSDEQTVRDAMRSIEVAKRDVSYLNDKIERIHNKIKTIDERINGLRKNMFDNAFDILDSSIARGENYVKEINDKKKFANDAIAQFEESIMQLNESEIGTSVEALQEKAEGYQKKLADAERSYDEASASYNTLKMQKDHFVQFKTYLANTKIEAISQIINSFLEEVGSNIRVSIDGYRVLKSGKLSEKITINLLRDGVESGSYGKHSGGERARVELASILAIQTLINAGCDDGKGLDFLALDEILEACDFEGISAACDTLNKLHKTSLVITQNAIEEGYPYQLVVTKENGISTIG